MWIETAYNIVYANTYTYIWLYVIYTDKQLFVYITYNIYMYTCVYTMHIHIFIYSLIHTVIYKFGLIFKAALYPEGSWDCVRIIFQKGWNSEKEEKNISAAVSFPFKFPLHLLPTFPSFYLWILSSGPNVQVQIMYLNGQSFKTKRAKRIFPSEEIV